MIELIRMLKFTGELLAQLGLDANEADELMLNVMSGASWDMSMGDTDETTVTYHEVTDVDR